MDEKKKKIVFIINPIAGIKSKKRFEKKIDSFFIKKNYEIVKHYSSYPGHASDIASGYADQSNVVIVAVGGDGTINEIARSLIDAGSSLGVIPLGSGNGFARHFNIPFAFDKALDTLIKGNEIIIDVGYLNGKPFFCTSGIGIDAETGYYYSKYSYRGLIAYALSFAKVFSGYKARNYSIEIDGVPYSFNAFFINIANISQFGYNFYVAPGASTVDGLLDVVVIKKFPKLVGLIVALRSFFGILQSSRYVWHKQAHHVKIHTMEKENIIHIDGEAVVMEGPLDYQIKRSCLKVIVNREDTGMPFFNAFKGRRIKDSH